MTKRRIYKVLDNPLDETAGKNLDKCMKLLGSMSVVWPSAGRALELLVGAKENIQEVMMARRARPTNPPRLVEPSSEYDAAQSISDGLLFAGSDYQRSMDSAP